MTISTSCTTPTTSPETVDRSCSVTIMSFYNDRDCCYSNKFYKYQRIFSKKTRKSLIKRAVFLSISIEGNLEGVDMEKTDLIFNSLKVIVQE